MGLFTSGSLPTEWAEQAVGIVDLDRFMAPHEVISFDFNVSLNNSYQGLAADPDNARLIHSVSYVSDVLDGDQRGNIVIAWDPREQTGTNAPGTPLEPTMVYVPGSNNLISNTRGGAGKYFAPPLWLNPGDTVGCLFTNMSLGAAGAIGSTMTVQFQTVPL